MGPQRGRRDGNVLMTSSKSLNQHPRFRVQKNLNDSAKKQKTGEVKSMTQEIQLFDATVLLMQVRSAAYIQRKKKIIQRTRNRFPGFQNRLQVPIPYMVIPCIQVVLLFIPGQPRVGQRSPGRNQFK